MPTTDPTPLLRIDGAVARPLALTFDDLRRFADADHVLDMTRFHPTRRGDGVTLDALLRLAGPEPAANYATLHAGRDDFHVSVPLAPLRAEAILVYRDGENPLTAKEGGPIRLLIRDPKACATGELDDCANVKYLDRIELTSLRGRDTRPADEAAHEALHRRQPE